MEFLALIQRTVSSIKLGESTPDFAISMGWHKGISGYVYQTVPIAIHARNLIFLVIIIYHAFRRYFP
jgi:hypothetical protein